MIDLFSRIDADALISIAISQKLIEMVSNETVIMKPYCKNVSPFLMVKSGEVELINTDKSTHLISENNFWYITPDSSQNNVLYAIKAISNSEVILLDSYLVHNLLIEKEIISEELTTVYFE
jgi:hypothetical protein